MNDPELAKLSTFIEENLRASPSAGLAFVDSRGFRDRLLSKQNHVVFGRRGAGKTSLVESAKGQAGVVDVYLNLEDFKDITFPNIVIHILLGMFSELRKQIYHRKWYCLFWPPVFHTLKDIGKVRKALLPYLHEPDQETQEVKSSEGYSQKMGAQLSTAGSGANLKASRQKTVEVNRSLPRNKAEYLRLELSHYKELIQSISKLFNHAPIFLVFDDFYFVQKQTQPELIDYFHRLTKGTDLFLKLATIKYRSKLYRRTHDQYVGAELGHDIFAVDMDYTLDNFEELQGFMMQLLRRAVEKSGTDVDVDKLFAGGGFAQLCLASGGVPRDFLSLFVTLVNKGVLPAAPIGKLEVNEVAIANLNNKMESMRRDSGHEDAILEGCLRRIKGFVYEEKRTNAFLIAKDDLDADVHARQAIRELVDLRLIHLVDHNTSRAPSDGRRYEAYILDIALYDNTRPRNFSQIEPGQRDEKARKDELRASPLFELKKLSEPIEPRKPREPIPENPKQLELVLTEE